MSEPIRYECPACGDLYFPSSQADTCPHDNNSTFTRAMIDEVRRRLRGNE